MSIVNRFGLLIWLVLILCLAGGMRIEYFWRDFVPFVGMLLIGTGCLLSKE